MHPSQATKNIGAGHHHYHIYLVSTITFLFMLAFPTQLSLATTSNQQQVTTQFITLNSNGADSFTATPFSSPISSSQLEAAAAVVAPDTTSSSNNKQQQSASTSSEAPINSWIESILINVENFNLNNNGHSRQPSFNGASSSQAQEENNNNNNNNNGQEDPLVVTSTIVPSQPSTSLTSISSETSNTNVVTLKPALQQQQQQEPLSSQSPLHTSTISQEAFDAKDEADDTDTDERLVDSNNVSAVLAPIPTRAMLTTTMGPRQAIGCEQAYTQCAHRKVCAPALRAYNDDCHDLINNRTMQCSTKCLKALIALRSSEQGDDLMNCDCQGNEYCVHSKQRSLACRPQVEQAIDPKTVVSCSTASWICMADQSCSIALGYYYHYCQSLFSQRHCSLHCNNSLAILNRQPKASKLINCYCDGSEEFPCVKYKTYTERFCLNKLTTTTTLAANNSGGGGIFNGGQTTEDQSPPEDDAALNLTNDPETFVLPAASSSASPSASIAVGGGAAGNFNDEEEYEDPRVAASTEDNGGGGGGGDTTDYSGSGHAEESSSVTGFNGIQLVEDNWIPSFRFFTNLHQQQQQQQQQKQKLKQQQQQILQRPSQRKGSSSQKSVKQKTKSNSTGHPHHHSESKQVRTRMHASRLSMFSSSSAASSSVILSTRQIFQTSYGLLVPLWMVVLMVLL